MLDAVIYVPGMTDTILYEVLLLDQKLVAFDRSPWHEKDVSVFDVLRILEQELVNDHLNWLKLRPHDIDLCAGIPAEVRSLQFL